MSFLEKVKNMFTEEVEDDDVKVEQIKKDVTHVAIDSPKSVTFDEDSELEEKIELNYIKKENKPIFFDDNDFDDLKFDSLSNEQKKQEEKEEFKTTSSNLKKDSYYENHSTNKEIYGSKIEKEPESVKIFKPTPIISPVYGVLNKNYHKEDIVSKNDKQDKKINDENIEPSIDSIRNKAYGTLEDELENTLFGTNSILFKKDNEIDSNADTEISEISSDDLSNLTEDISKELDELLVKKEKYSCEKDSEDEVNSGDLFNFIDSTLYKDGEE